MFFNQDILFKNGPLSLIWMAGNDELRFKDTRSRRNKQYLLILDSNLVQLCDLVRQQFPQMGTSKGMNLKKVATLIKGLGVIYISKLDNLARNMSDMNIRLQVATAARLREIDLPTFTTTRATAAILVANEEIAPMLGFGALEDADDMYFGAVRFEIDVPSSPRANPRMPDAEHYPELLMTPPGVDDSVRKDRGKKRKKGKSAGDELNEETVLRMLQDTVAHNQRANCLVEGNGIEPGVSDRNDPFDDFNQFNPEFDIPLEINLHTGSGESGDSNPVLEMIASDQRLSSPPGRRSTSGGPIRSQSPIPIPIDEQLQNDASHPQETNSEMEFRLESLNRGNGGRVPHRGRRRSKRLQIDQETTIPLEQMRDELRRLREPLDYDAMRIVMAGGQALTQREALKATQGIKFVDRVGRKIHGRQLSHFVDSQLELLRKIPRMDTRIEAIRREETGSGIEQSNASGNQAEVSRPEVPVPELEIEPLPLEINEIADTRAQSPGDQNDPTFAPAFIDDHDDFANGVGIENQENRMIQTSQDDLPPDQTTFRAMFPPATASRKQAAVGFFQLLRLQSKRLVALEQEEPYGDIIIFPTPTGGR